MTDGTVFQDLPWVAQARASLGVAEIPGYATSPVLARWLIGARALWSDDEHPWCGLAMWAWMKACGYTTPTLWALASSWLDWGVPIGSPGYGAVVVFDWGYVGIVVGKDPIGRLWVIGGDQKDRVGVALFDRDAAILGYRWPSEALLHRGEHPLYVSERPPMP